MKCYKLTLVNTGGEYSYGYVKNEEEINLINQKIEEGEVSLKNSDDSVEASFYMYEDLLHTYGPSIDNPQISLEKYKDEELTEFEEYIVNEENLENDYLYNITLENPYFDSKKVGLKENELVFGGFYIEKNIHFPVALKLEDDEEFEMNNVFYGTINMDETLSSDEIVTKAFYIREDKQDEILKYYDDEFVEESKEDKKTLVIEAIQELIDSEDIDIAKKVQLILNESELEKVDDIEGQGSSKMEYVIILDSKGEELFQS